MRAILAAALLALTLPVQAEVCRSYDYEEMKDMTKDELWKIADDYPNLVQSIPYGRDRDAEISNCFKMVDRATRILQKRNQEAQAAK